MSHEKVWQLGELFIHGEPSQARPYIDQRKESRRHELVTIKPNGRIPAILEVDTVAFDIASPQEALSTVAPKMGDKLTSEAKDMSQDIRTVPELLPVEIPSSNGNASNGIDSLSRSNIGPPLTIENMEGFQSLSSRNISPMRIKDARKIQKSSSVNGSALNLVNSKINFPAHFRGQSSNGHTIDNDISSLNIQASERSYMYTPIIDLPPESGRYKPPELTISETFVLYSSTDIHMSNASGPPILDEMNPILSISPIFVQHSSPEESMRIPLDATYNDVKQEVISDRQESLESVPDGRRHPESIHGPEKVENEDQEERLRCEAKLNSLHSRTLQTRSLGYEKRSQLRYLRAEMNAVEEDFMKCAQEKCVQGNHDDSGLDASFKKLQAARVEHSQLEEVYNALEERLDQEEYKITQLQARILSGVSILGDRDSDVNSLSSGSDKEDSENLEGMQESDHPIYEEYLSRLGDADLCREEHFNLLAQYKNLLEEEEVCQRYGGKLQLEKEIILAKFPANEAKLLEQLRQIEEDVERLRRECTREGLLGNSGDEEGPSESEESDILESSNGAISLEQTEFGKYPLLLPQPNQWDDGEWSKSLITEFKQNDTGDRITRWLLHKLRSSCSEVELLMRYSEGFGPTVDTERWQEEVLDFWFVDSSNLPPSAYHIERTLTAFPPSPLTDLNRAAPARFGDGELIQLVIRSSSLSRKLELGIWLKLARMKGKSAMSV